MEGLFGISNFVYARSLMALSLGFHIIFAVIGVGLPMLMAVVQLLHHLTKNPLYETLSRKWAKGTAVLFVIGAISGTVLSFELGLIWPRFMEVSGPIIGVAFAMEGFAFFMEAIFLGIFLYGRDRLPPAIHTAVGFIVALAGACSAVFVVATNAWMNFPLADASDPFKEVFGSPMFFQMAVHLVLGSYVACFGLVAGVHAIILLSKKMFKKFHVQDYEVHHKAFKVAAIAMSLLIPLQLVSGDYSAKVIAKSQPAKFAAMEALFKTQEAAPLSVGGIADVKERKLKYAIEIPHALSFLAHGDFNTAVTGLEEFPEEDWPIVNVVHLAFDTMVGSGSLMLLLGLITLFKVFIQRTGLLSSKLWLAYALATPLGLIAIETGWIVTEVGRQPWIIYGRMRTIDAVTTSAELGPYFYGYAALYIILLSTMILVMQRIFRDKV